MTGFAGKVLVHARGNGLLDLDMAILARGLALDMPHAFRACLMTVRALDLFAHMHVLGQTSRLGEILAKIAVAAPSLHGPCMADKGAPAASGAVRSRWYTAHSVASPLTGRCVVTVEAACVTEVAGLLLGDRLVVRDWLIDLIDDLFGVLEGEPVAFSPADRQGICKGGPSIIRAVDIVPGPHGALSKIGAHHARVELRHLVRMAG